MNDIMITVQCTFFSQDEIKSLFNQKVYVIGEYDGPFFLDLLYRPDKQLHLSPEL